MDSEMWRLVVYGPPPDEYKRRLIDGWIAMANVK